CKRPANTTAALHSNAPSTTRETAHPALRPTSDSPSGATTSNQTPASDTRSAKQVCQLNHFRAVKAAIAATIKGSSAIIAPRAVPLTAGAAIAANRLKHDVSNTPMLATFSQVAQPTPPWRSAATTH